MPRKKKKELVEQINYATVAKPHISMYLMHKYWARKPHNVVSEYIQNYTKEGDIVLDPFCGSGPTPIEAIKIGRKGIGIDLNPISTFVTRMTAMPIDINQIKKAFEEIKNNCKKEINDLYKTKCKKCKNNAIILATIWDREKAEPLEIRYYCGNCKARNAKKPDDEDLKLLKKIEKMNILYWYPTQRLAYDGNGFMKKEKVDSIPNLFTKRNLIALSILFNQIQKIKDSKIKETFKFAFTSISHLASKMCPVAKPGGKGHWSKFSATSFWALQSYWVPPLNMESNVWMLFDSAIHGAQGILKGKTDSNAQIKYYKEAKKFEDLNDGANVFLKTHNALDIKDIIPENSVDYVFTDPPYGGAVQYFELSTLWASWLKMNLDYKGEITVNKFQNKDFEYYHKMLKAAFSQVFFVLKPGKYLTVTFHSTDIKVWNSIIKAVIMSNFELEKILYQPPARPSAKELLQPYGSAVGDYYIRFKKPEKGEIETQKQLDIKTYELEVIDAAQRIIGERKEPTIYQHILNGIMVELRGGRNVPTGAKNIEEILKEHVGKEFELIPIKNEKGKIVGKKWWLKGKDLSNFTTPALSDRIERTVLQVLGKVKVSFDEVLQRLFMDFPNALTPDTQSIKEFLNEYAIKTEDGKWQLKPGLNEKARASQHTKMIYLLAVLGKKAGFNVLIGKNEQRDVYNGKRLSTFCDKIPVLRFVPQDDDSLGRIKQIDILWLEDGRIRYEFEVENTTGISLAIIRGSNIPTDYLKPKRFIVIPKERETLLHKRLQEPLIKKGLEKDKWDFIRYDDLENLYNKLKSKKKINPEEIHNIAKMPREIKHMQNSLKVYLC